VTAIQILGPIRTPWRPGRVTGRVPGPGPFGAAWPTGLSHPGHSWHLFAAAYTRFFVNDLVGG